MHPEYDINSTSNVSQQMGPGAGMGLGPHAKEIVYTSFILATAGQLALLISIFTHLRSIEATERSASWLNLIVATLLSTVPPYLL